MPSGSARQLPPIALRFQLGVKGVRLLEVVPDDLVGLARTVGEAFVEPVGKALVQLGPRLLQDGAIRDVTDEDVLEAKGLLSAERGPDRPDQFFADKACDGASNLRLGVFLCPALLSPPART